MKTSLHKTYHTDKGKEVDGVWYTTEGGEQFKIARWGGANNTKMMEATAKYYAPYADKIEKNELDKKEVEKITYMAFSEICIKDWKNVEIDGKEAPYSSEVMVDILIDLPELADELVQFSQERKEFLYREELGND